MGRNYGVPNNQEPNKVAEGLFLATAISGVAILIFMYVNGYIW